MRQRKRFKVKFDKRCGVEVGVVTTLPLATIAAASCNSCYSEELTTN